MGTLFGLCCRWTRRFSKPHRPKLKAHSQAIKRTGGRLGVALVDSAGNVLASNRAEERFAMCSTFKASLAAAMMVAQDAGKLDRFAEIAVILAVYLDRPDVDAKTADAAIADVARVAVKLVGLPD